MIKLGYLFTSDSVDRQVDHRIYRLIWVAVYFWGGEGWLINPSGDLRSPSDNLNGPSGNLTYPSGKTL